LKRNQIKMFFFQFLFRFLFSTSGSMRLLQSLILLRFIAYSSSTRYRLYYKKSFSKTLYLVHYHPPQSSILFMFLDTFIHVFLVLPPLTRPPFSSSYHLSTQWSTLSKPVQTFRSITPYSNK